MKTSTAAHYFNICKEAYEGDEKREAFAPPQWLSAFKNDKIDAQVSFTSLQATLLMLLNQGGEFLTLYPNLVLGPEQTMAEFCAAWGVMLKVIQEPQPYLPLSSALSGLAEYARFTGGTFKTVEKIDRGAAASIHQLVAEACQRDAAFVTPVDVATFMAELSLPDQPIDVYALNGLGLLYGARSRTRQVHLVGDEFGRAATRAMPLPLQNTYHECQIWYRHELFSNRQFIDFEWQLGTQADQSSTLLVNAVNETLPFLSGAKENSTPSLSGALNHVLEAEYKRVIVLVSNHFLTAGRGLASKILAHCMRLGLAKVIQLPMGVLGFRSQEHSVLVFEGGASATEVEFIKLEHGHNTVTAPKGFGEPRKANTLKRTSPDEHGIPLGCMRESVTATNLQNSGRKKLLSFEAGQFLKVDPLSKLRDQAEFMRIHEFMEVFRAHHIQETGEQERSEYLEIGAGSIDAYGWIGDGKPRLCAASSLTKRSAQILRDQDIVLCFRGSPESFGKAGLYRDDHGVTAVPNQSFVILRRKTLQPNNAPSVALLLWWLNSFYGRKCMELKSITPDVIRMAPKDIAEMEVPVGPPDFIQGELKKMAQAEVALQEMKRIEEEIREIRARAWR